MQRRVLHITSGLELGGAEQILVNCAAAGRDREFEPLVIALKSDGPTRELLVEKHIRVVELGLSVSRPSPLAITQTIGIMRSFRPHIIKSWMYHANIFATGVVALTPGVNRDQLFCGIYNSALDLKLYGRQLRAAIEAGRLFSHYPACIVYNSVQALADHERMGFKHRSAAVVNNGIDLKRFVANAEKRSATRSRLGISPEASVAIIVARYDPQKDWESVLAGVAQVEGLTTIAVGPTTKFLPEQPGLVRLGAEMAMENIYPAADVFLLPSAFGEGTSVAMCEAMACEVPPIVTDVGDNARFAIDCGKVVAQRSPNDIASALRDLLSDASQLKKLGQKARSIAEQKFGPQASFQSLFDRWEQTADSLNNYH